MMRKTFIALLTLTAVGLIQPTLAFARGGGGGDHRSGASQYHVRYRDRRVAGLCPADAGVCAWRVAEGIRDGFARGGRRHLAADVLASAAELHCTADRAGYTRLFLGDSRRCRAWLSRPRRAAACGGVGGDAGVGAGTERERECIDENRLAGAGFA